MRLLIIGILDGHIGAASRIAMDRGAKVLHTDRVDEALNILRAGSGADVVMIDVGLDVRSLVDSLTSERIIVPVVACGIGNDARAAVSAIRAGAKEYLPLPPDAELIAAVLAAVSQDDHAIIHADPKMADLLQLADRVARSDAGILISGPSGTGKELLARFVHARSRRADGRVVAVNCAAIPENLLESELFGHEKGAFTGAVARRVGRFEEANGGTLLLDEISEMDVRLQAKLLRAIQEREIDRLGGSAPVKVDARIIATTNRDLEAHVRDGQFRADLYFRLNVVTLEVPALCERPRDIPVLAEHFLEKFAHDNGLQTPVLTSEARRALLSCAWPGNVRELENTLHRAVLLAEQNTIDEHAFAQIAGTAPGRPEHGVEATSAGCRSPLSSAAGGTHGLIGRTVADVERDLIIDTLHHCLGNRTHAATILGISIRTLRNKLRQYTTEGFTVPMPGEGERTLA